MLEMKKGLEVHKNPGCLTLVLSFMQLLFSRLPPIEHWILELMHTLRKLKLIETTGFPQVFFPMARCQPPSQILWGATQDHTCFLGSWCCFVPFSSPLISFDSCPLSWFWDGIS